MSQVFLKHRLSQNRSFKRQQTYSIHNLKAFFFLPKVSFALHVQKCNHCYSDTDGGRKNSLNMTEKPISGKEACKLKE